MNWNTILAGALSAIALGSGLAAQAQEPQPKQTADAQVAALKGSVQQGLAKARPYEWVETTIIRLKGEEKGRKQNRCYYGADGKVQKISLDQPAQEETQGRRGRGERTGPVKGRAVEHKTDEMKDYMERAAALIHQYVPPSPEKIQAAKDAGRVAVTQQSGNARIAISQYLKQGDMLTVDINPATSALLGLSVSSYLDKPDEPVTLAVKMTTLADGALYAAETTLDAKAKGITVVVENSGYKPVSK